MVILGLPVLFRSTRVDAAPLWGFCGEGALVIPPQQGECLMPCQRGPHTICPVTEQGWHLSVPVSPASGPQKPVLARAFPDHMPVPENSRVWRVSEDWSSQRI